jgi:isocitrate lyase
VRGITVETITEQAANLRKAWETDRRWSGIQRDYTAEDVIRLRGTVAGEAALAQRGARRLWELLRGDSAILGADQIARAVGPADPAASIQQPAAPIVADAGPGFGGLSDAFDLMKTMIEAGAAGVLFDDLLSSEKAGGQLGGQVLVPTGQHIKTLNAARLAADVLDVPALVIARTHAHSVSLLTSDADEQDHEFLTGERTAEGFHRVRPGLYAGVTRGLAFAPYADLLWLETPTPSLAEARAFADLIYSQHPDQLLAYSCSPSFNWRSYLDDASIAKFRKELAAMGYRVQFAGSSPGCTASRHQDEADADYFGPDTPQFALR